MRIICLFVTILLPRNLVQYFLFFFTLLDSPKKSNKEINKTNKQTNRKNAGRDTATAVANYSGPGY